MTIGTVFRSDSHTAESHTGRTLSPPDPTPGTGVSSERSRCCRADDLSATQLLLTSQPCLGLPGDCNHDEMALRRQQSELSAAEHRGSAETGCPDAFSVPALTRDRTGAQTDRWEVTLLHPSPAGPVQNGSNSGQTPERLDPVHWTLYRSEPTLPGPTLGTGLTRELPWRYKAR